MQYSENKTNPFKIHPSKYLAEVRPLVKQGADGVARFPVGHQHRQKCLCDQMSVWVLRIGNQHGDFCSPPFPMTCARMAAERNYKSLKFK